MTIVRASISGAKKRRKDYASGTGPASYATASKPTMTMANLRQINGLEDVTMVGNGVYIPVPDSVSQNVITYAVFAPNAGAALAAHQHDITTVNAAGGGAAMTAPSTPGSLEDAGGGQVNTNAVDGASAGTPAISEVSDTTVLSGVTFYAEAIGS